ncbi:MAG: glutamine synthetase family protein [Pseudomonadales bacterium]|nr:glutamine synthetase family protein [Pseudomonadales bacterium]
MNAASKAQQRLLAWLASGERPGALRAVVCDLNGIFRGKRVPLAAAGDALAGLVKLPVSTLFVDVWGDDALASGMILETGDRDGLLVPTERGLLPVDWLGVPAALLPCTMREESGGPSLLDGRNLLAAITARWQARGFTPVCALELEFYLHEPTTDSVSPPRRPDGARLTAGDVYSLQDLDGFEDFLGDVYAACDRFGIAVGQASSEVGCGQFELNFRHVADPLRAADDAQLFKYLVKGVAARHGFGATFMAKPYGDQAGSGLHVHFSLVDAAGHNAFAGDGPAGSPLLAQAVAGLITDMPDAMLLFAPHFNSYRRVREGSHAPTQASWGLENRTAAIRIPAGADADRRIEHRVAGADANPYLVLATLLGSALRGVEEGLVAPPPTQGSAYDGHAPRLPTGWAEAIHCFEESKAMRAILGEDLVRVFAATKRQERDLFAARLSPFEVETYLDLI